MNFLTKLVALKPGKAVQDMIKNVMQGKDEGAENSGSDEEISRGIKGRVSFKFLNYHMLNKMYNLSYIVFSYTY